MVDSTMVGQTSRAGVMETKRYFDDNLGIICLHTQSGWKERRDKDWLEIQSWQARILAFIRETAARISR